jgi:trimethylamine--corrinoid protein Co-methyltransferase
VKQRLSTAVPRLQLLGSDQCDAIHYATLEILRRTGVRVFHHQALELLRQSDALVTDQNLVRFPCYLVEWALKQAPSRVGLCQRGSDQVVVPLEGRQVSFGTGSDCPNILDPRTGDRRSFTGPDLADVVRLVDALPEMSFCMSMGIPSGVATEEVFRHQFAAMIRNTDKPIVFVCGDRADCDAITAMAAACAGGTETLRVNPSILLYSEPSTPLKHSQPATDKLLFMAEHGLPVVHSPAPMMGATAPVTLAGGLALGNAEVLSSLVMHQLKRPGAPFVYGSGLHHLDMKTMISVYGAPEFQLARTAVAEMGRYYGLPTWGYAGHTDSCVVDEQAAADAAFSVLVALLSGANLVHDVGYVEAGLTTSPEMIVLTAELIGMMRKYDDGIKIDGESLALEVIHQVGPGGDYLSSNHTLKHFREYWSPQLFSRQRYEKWAATGARHLGSRLRERTVALIEGHQPKPLPDNVVQEITYVLTSSG